MGTERSKEFAQLSHGRPKNEEGSADIDVIFSYANLFSQNWTTVYTITVLSCTIHGCISTQYLFNKTWQRMGDRHYPVMSFGIVNTVVAVKLP